jgi:hypothetical protein
VRGWRAAIFEIMERKQVWCEGELIINHFLGDLKMKRLVICIVFCAGVFLTGCASKEQTREYARMGVNALDKGTEVQLAIAQANPALDQVKLARTAVDFGEYREHVSAEFELLRKEIEEEKRRREEFFTTVLEIAASAAPGGSTGIRVAQAIFSAIGKSGREVEAVAAAETREVRREIEKNREELKGMSTEELGILLAAMGSAAGVGGALGKTGKSRAYKEVVKIEGMIAELKGRLDLAEEPPKRIGKG